MSSDHSFQPGARYRVRTSFKALRSTFVEGEMLVYESSAWSRYDGITGYFFLCEDGGSRSWDVYDDQPSDWQALFERLD